LVGWVGFESWCKVGYFPMVAPCKIWGGGAILWNIFLCVRFELTLNGPNKKFLLQPASSSGGGKQGGVLRAGLFVESTSGRMVYNELAATHRDPSSVRVQ
jgi:hypothetical protein